MCASVAELNSQKLTVYFPCRRKAFERTSAIQVNIPLLTFGLTHNQKLIIMANHWHFFPEGSVHETHTITDTIPDVVLVSGSLSAEFSWFPGYSWRFVHCALCHSHLGWKYYSQSLRPKTFVGLTGRSILFENRSSTENKTQEDIRTIIDAVD